MAHNLGPTPLLAYGICGTDRPAPGKPSYFDVMRHAEVQRLLLDLASAPRKTEFLRAALRRTGVSVPHLEHLRLSRRRGEDWVIGFPLFMHADFLKVITVVEKHLPTLVQGFLARRSEIEAILDDYTVKGVEAASVAYIILGCFSLDWDGLDLTTKKGYRSPLGSPPGGSGYSPWAEERGQTSTRGVFNGSHNEQVGPGCVFTSFGDSDSVPRFALPDLLWKPLGDVSRDKTALTAKPGEAGGARLPLRVAREAGEVLYALRSGARDLGAIADATRVPSKDLSRIMSLLLRLDYIAKRADEYQVHIPVLAIEDRPVVAALRGLGKDVVSHWLGANYDQMKSALQEITPLQSGVSYPECFTQIWHEAFGRANRQLVKAGMFANPYSLTRQYRGFIPSVWHPALREGTGDATA